ncbi:MAG TPA: class I SAM-dependent methyltransferase [Gemmataceae bacterium]|nr:class I SAM-dependent methyltransferase [Gemmataceae bacterium]
MPEPFSYDVVEYPSAPLPQMHPGHLFAVARLYGFDAAPVERCRYLEIGCGGGTHLIACAYGVPDATFVGIDLSSAAIDRGNRMIAELGLPNVTLHAADLTRWEPPDQRFDYVVSHGLYSWVPARVRDALLGLVARCLPPTGVGYVSYNVYPGCFLRRMVWEMMRHHTAGFDDPRQKTEQAIEFVNFLAAGQPAKPDPGLAAFAKELNDIKERNTGLLYHDDLCETNEPVYFHQFAAHAGRFGLRFVAEADPMVMATRAMPPPVAHVLDGMAEQDVLDKEQYLDFLRLRRFRQTLVSTDGRAPRKEPDPAAVSVLAASGRPKADSDPVDLSPGVGVTFSTGAGAAIRTDSDIAKAALTVLTRRWPGRVWFRDLVGLAARDLRREPTPADTDTLADLMVRVWTNGLVELHGHVPRYVEVVSERPVASPLARIQARTGPLAVTMLLTPMLFDDAPSRRMLQLLDGTRTREQIAEEMESAFAPESRPDPAALRAGIDQRLERMARGGLLVG